ncbi:MAG: alanine--tRNA ligase [Halorhodospira halophila]|uniref:alanine--tRNA ligase n=1 Tax=Halorhodospira TaxID=85108 RepID=UPI0019120EDD|nr:MULTISPECIES: alanine--tRNA ligase [Halorhodospira]MBK5936427.1 alanine--tRNA ligase [Halorhodospira halophila]MCC3750445.1 alanine--tRNA ligase [Halorhodospira halophila]MCG5536912.1 alanine--tRNA ligase [Halorhodospira sp. 9622]MCG5539639.1 alanine--tRNA ligase [Halorhodospira sp. M39old]MCG5545449.1 alanine--tRNA ligase [Halorhodospira sp. M38]
MTSAQLRAAFLEFFRERGHEVVPSSPLVPANDPTLLFTNAGMVPFKEVFLGREQRGYQRAASSQRCVRAGGKHNDLENVGYTARHHTFFEMLGNFSFGDYFKRDAIRYAWTFLTEVVGLPAERLWVTVYEDDDEAARIWLEEIGVDPARFRRIGAHDNFWSMGDTGPCGPCSEVFYDHGPEVAGGPPGSEDEDGDRYIEVWNLVFMQYDRDAEGNLHPLPSPSIDTGMGLERLAAVMQGVHDNYETDLFTPLLDAAGEIAGVADRRKPSLKVVADHIRACSFLIVDGVLPSTEGRGYVLRRIIRRAVRHGYQLGIDEPFFYRLVESLDTVMGEAFPELRERREFVEKILFQEEKRFRETLEDGLALLDDYLSGSDSGVIDGEVVFKLYDTHGFPVDLTADIARERGLEVDDQGFEARMAEQRERARAASRFGGAREEVVDAGESRFTGYETLEDVGSVTGLYQDGRSVQQLQAGEQGMVVLDRTPFYAESGGQVGDRGEILANGLRFRVEDTVKQGDAHGHLGRLEAGQLGVGDQVTARVDRGTREATVRNHSATHLLHAALREVLGDHVQQKGSLVAPDRLRFDFSHYEAPSREELAGIEARVNEEILTNHPVEAANMAYEEAVQAGAMALFGEKYGDTVRVISVGDYSRELCGGTHAARTGDIGLFKIVDETGVAGGVRRIEALTGERALGWVQEAEERLNRLSDLLRVGPDNLVMKVEQLSERAREQEKEIERLKQKLATQAGRSLLDDAGEVAGVRFLATCVEGGGKGLRDTLDQLKNQLGSGVIVLAAVQGEKVQLVAGVTKDLTDRLSAGDLVNHVAAQVGGRGGGRADFAQAGGKDPSRVNDALASVEAWIKDNLT